MLLVEGFALPELKRIAEVVEDRVARGGTASATESDALATGVVMLLEDVATLRAMLERREAATLDLAAGD